jgi:hypothetical protein
LDFEAIEMAARRQTLRLAARALEQRLNSDTSDHVVPQLPCRCGGSAQYHGRHQKTFESALGPLHLQHCNALTINCAISCGKGSWSLQLHIDVYEYSKWLDRRPIGCLAFSIYARALSQRAVSVSPTPCGHP